MPINYSPYLGKKVFIDGAWFVVSQIDSSLVHLKPANDTGWEMMVNVSVLSHKKLEVVPMNSGK
jgi:hypothetical protein